MPSQLDRIAALEGGIVRDVSNWANVNRGFHSLTGMHTNTKSVLTKVSGSEKFSVSAVGGNQIRGLWQVRLNGTTYYFAATADGKIKRINGATITNLATGLSDAYWDGRTIGAIFFMAGGTTNGNKKILSTLAVQNVGVAAPASAVTLADGGAAGSPNGTYTYKHTYYNSLSNQESDSSVVSASITVASRKILVSGLGGAVDTQVDFQRIYRTTGTGSGIWLRVAEIAAATTTYLDNIADSALGIAYTDDNGVPPAASYLELFNGMMFYAGLATPNESRIAVSGVLRPEACDADNVYDLEPDEDDIITGIKKFGQAIAVYKQTSIWLGAGSTPDGMDFVKTRVAEGALGNWGIIPFNSMHWYLGEKGVFTFNGLTEQYMSSAIEELYKTFDLTTLANASGVYYKPLNLLIWNVRTAGVSDFDSWLMYNIKTQEWSTRSHATSKLSTYKDVFGRSVLWMGGVNGYTYNGDRGNADDGTDIVVDIILRGICLGFKDKQPDLDQLYCFRHIELLYDANGGSEPVTISYALDDPDSTYYSAVNPADGTSVFTPTTGERIRFDIPELHAYGRLIFVRIQASSQEALIIRGVRVEGNGLGRR